MTGYRAQEEEFRVRNSTHGHKTHRSRLDAVGALDLVDVGQARRQVSCGFATT